MRFVEGDWYAPLAGERFDLIVANPPYEPSELCDGLSPELRHEPRLALDGGADGMDLVEIGQRAVFLGQGDGAGQVGDVAVHRIDALEGDQLGRAQRRGGQQFFEVHVKFVEGLHEEHQVHAGWRGVVQVGDDFPRLNQQRHATLNRRNRHGLRFGKVVAADGHETRNGPGRRRSAQRARIGLLCFSTACGPLGDNSKTAAEPLALELPP